jgi:hypothetical protein
VKEHHLFLAVLDSKRENNVLTLFESYIFQIIKNKPEKSHIIKESDYKNEKGDS